MGKVMAKAKITNFADQVSVMNGVKTAEEVRSVEIEGLVDTGATMLVIPEDMADNLGLMRVRKVTVRYANGRREEKDVARGVVVEIMGREALVECLVEEAGTQVLIGQIPLEAMDLVVDPQNGSLGPRLESPDTPLIDLL